MQDEEKAKKEHFGNAKGIKLLIRKLTWHKWDRTNCHSGCPILHVYEKEHFYHIKNSPLSLLNTIGQKKSLS